MKDLLPLGLLGGAIYFFTKKDKKATVTSTEPYFKDNGYWFCAGSKGFQGFDLTQEVIKNSSVYEKLTKDLTPSKSNGYNLRELATEVLKQKFKGFKDGVVNFFTGKSGVVSKVTGLGGKIVILIFSSFTYNIVIFVSLW